MLLRKKSLTTVAALLTLTSLGLAQPAPPAPAPPAPAPAGTPASTEPVLPNVDDPMLQPLPAPKNVLSTWQQALALVRAKNTSLRIQIARVDEARAISRQALSAMLPTLTGNATINRHLLLGEGVVFNDQTGAVATGSVPDPATTWNAGLTLNIPVFAPQSWYDRGTTERAIDYAKLNVKSVERLVVGSVADAIVAVVTSERLAEISRVSLKSALSTLDLSRRRTALGASSMIDVLRTEQEVALSRSQVVSADDAAWRARDALGTALGSAEQWGVRPDIRLDQLSTEAKTSCRPEKDITTRSDVLAAEANVALAQRGVKSVDWSYWPTVDAISQLTYHGNRFTSPNDEHVTWTIGGLLTWQIYDGGLRYGVKDQRKATLRISEEQSTDTKRQATLEVRQAYRNVFVAEALLAVNTKNRDVAAENARLSRVAFLNGSGTSFDLVDTARRLREAELDLVIREFELLRAKIAALLALATCNV